MGDRGRISMMLAPTMGKESGVQNCHVNHRATRHVPPAHVSTAEMPPPPLNTSSLGVCRAHTPYACCLPAYESLLEEC